MPLHVDPRKQELLEARIQGTNVSSQQFADTHFIDDSSTSIDCAKINSQQHPLDIRKQGSGLSDSEDNDVDSNTGNVKITNPDREKILTNGNPIIDNYFHPNGCIQSVESLSKKRPDYIPACEVKQRVQHNEVNIEDSSDNCDPIPQKCLHLHDEPVSMSDIVAPGQFQEKSNHHHISPDKTIPRPGSPDIFMPSVVALGGDQPSPNRKNLHASPNPTEFGRAKKKRKPSASEDSTGPKPRKIACQERGSRRIDELFKHQGSGSNQGMNSSSPPLENRCSSPPHLSSSGNSLDQPAPPKSSFADLAGGNSSLNETPSRPTKAHFHLSPHCITSDSSGGDTLRAAEPLSTSTTSNATPAQPTFSISLPSSCHASVQTESPPPAELSKSLSQPNMQSLSPTSVSLLDTVDTLNRRIAELELELGSQRESVVKLQETVLRSRQIIRDLLIEKSNMERKATRKKVVENRVRLGQFVTQRQGTHFDDKWVEGSRFKELDQRRKNIEVIREEIERRRKQWNKRKPLTGDAKKSTKSKVEEVSVDEYYEQIEVFDLRKQMLIKEDKEIQLELERLDRERNVHIREIKRIANEDASRFKDHQILNERYLLLNLLGKGGFSEVHKGYDLVSNCYVACKVHQLNPTWAKDKKDNYIKHALREINIHKTLDHSRIVKVFDVFDIDHDAFCTVLEYCEGNDLDFFLKQNKCIPEREAKSIICQVLSALKYLNMRNPPVIHYDLKPGNILFGSGQASGEIKITDFGLSKLMTEDQYNPETGGMDLTSQGAGTYWYLPPECFETGHEPPKISSKVDVWSVGVIFYQCLFGKKPFGHNMSQADILHDNVILQAKSIVFPSAVKVGEGAKEFIRKCCTYRKDLRPDVFQLCNDDYLKPKAQLRHSVDSSTLPGPVGTPQPGYSPLPITGLQPIAFPHNLPIAFPQSPQTP